MNRVVVSSDGVKLTAHILDRATITWATCLDFLITNNLLVINGRNFLKVMRGMSKKAGFTVYCDFCANKRNWTEVDVL